MSLSKRKKNRSGSGSSERNGSDYTGGRTGYGTGFGNKGSGLGGRSALGGNGTATERNPYSGNGTATERNGSGLTVSSGSGSGYTATDSGIGITGNPNTSGLAGFSFSEILSMAFGAYGSNGFDSILGNIGNVSSDVLAQFFSALGIHERKGFSESEAKDWNQYLLKLLIQRFTENENRAYNQYLRDEQRQYDMPSNVLNRLLSTGMSRDAALGLLSGTGAEPIQNTLGSMPDTLSPSEGQANGTAAVSNVASVAYGAVSLLGSLVSCGMSVPAAVSQIGILGAQQAMSQKQVKAYDDSSVAFNLISSAHADGSLSDEIFNDGHVYDSVSSVTSAIEHLSTGGNVTAKRLVSSGFIDGIRDNAPYVSEFLSKLYRQERDGRDYDTSFGLQVGKLRASIDVDKVTAKSLAKGLEKADAEIAKIYSEQEFIQGQTAFLEYSKMLAEKQGKVFDEQAYLMHQQAYAQQLQNNYESAFQVATDLDGRTGLQLVTASRLTQATIDAHTLAKLTDMEQWEHEAERIISDADAAATYNAWRIWYYGAGLDVVNDPDYEGLYSACAAMDECGFFDYISTVASLTEEQYNATASNGGIVTSVRGGGLNQVIQDMSKTPARRNSSWFQRVRDRWTMSDDEYRKKYGRYGR